MKYIKFLIKNFRGIDEVSIDLRNNRIISLVGLNESGKTTIMDAISFFYSLSRGWEIKSDLINTFRPKGIDFTGEIIMEAFLKFEPEDYLKIQSFWESQMKTTTLKFPDEFSYKFKFEFKLHQYIETKKTWDIGLKTTDSEEPILSADKEGWNSLVRFIRQNIVPEILYYDDFTLDIPANISISKSKTEFDNWFYMLDDILKNVNSALDFKEHIIDIWETDPVASQRLTYMEGMINEKITKKWIELFGKEKTHFKEIKINREFKNDALHISFKVISENNNEFLVNERSKGFKWFFSYLLHTEFRKKRTRNILFLLDEPASNLHSTAQIKILDAINDLSSDSLVIYSTHSHHLIKPEWLSGTYICINEKLTEDMLKGGFSSIKGAKITAKKYFNYVGLGLGSDKVSYFQPILDALDYQPSYVEPIPNVTILEGKNDWYTYKYFAEIIIKDNTEFNFYPGAGRDKLWDIIRLYLAWGKHFIVVLDGDKPSIESKDNYIDEFREHLQEKIYTLEDIIGKKISTEGLIEDDDKELIYNKIFGDNSFDSVKSNPKELKKNLNYAINQLLIQKVELELSKKTVSNFKKLFKFIKDKQGI
jgi:predicted ATPase